MWQASLVCPLSEVFELCTVKDRSGELNAELSTCSTKDSLENLTEVHTRRHTKRIEHKVNGTAILKERHVFLTYHLRYDTLITVTSCKFVADTNLTFLGNIYLCHLKNA